MLWFAFDLEADLRPVYDWNTFMVFAYLSVEFESERSDYNRVIVWDDRLRRDEPAGHVVRLEGQEVEYPLTDTFAKLK